MKGEPHTGILISRSDKNNLKKKNNDLNSVQNQKISILNIRQKFYIFCWWNSKSLPHSLSADDHTGFRVSGAKKTPG